MNYLCLEYDAVYADTDVSGYNNAQEGAKLATELRSGGLENPAPPYGTFKGC